MSVKKEYAFFSDLNPEPTNSSGQEPVRLDLKTSQIVHVSGSKEAFPLDPYPIFLFLKAVGFDAVQMRPSTEPAAWRDLFSQWIERMISYEQSYIQDPENFVIEECVWNELDPEDSSFRIECFYSAAGQPNKKQNLADNLPPPLGAPIRVDEEARVRFLKEIEAQPPSDVLLRIQSILKEFKIGSHNQNPEIWTVLVSDIIAVSLETKLIEKAVQIAKDFETELALVWKSRERTLRLLSAFDPKTTDSEWTRVFESLPTSEIFSLLKDSLSSSAGPQILKLMQYRSQNEPERMVEIVLDSESPQELKNLIFPWMNSLWRAKHYPELFARLKAAIPQAQSEQQIKLWIHALLRSNRTQAFRDLGQFFSENKLKFWSKPFPHVQRAILDVIEESSGLGAEVIVHLKEWKARSKGMIADRIEKILSLHSSRRSNGGGAP